MTKTDLLTLPAECVTPTRARTVEGERPLAEMLDDVVAAIAAGETVEAACGEAGLTPRRFWRCLARGDLSPERYMAATATAAERRVAEIQEIADEKPPLVVDEKGAARVDAGFVAWQRNRIDVRKWAAARHSPRRYGERLELDAKVSVGGAIIERLTRAKERIAGAAPAQDDDQGGEAA